MATPDPQPFVSVFLFPHPGFSFPLRHEAPKALRSGIRMGKATGLGVAERRRGVAQQLGMARTLGTFAPASWLELKVEHRALFKKVLQGCKCSISCKDFSFASWLSLDEPPNSLKRKALVSTLYNIYIYTYIYNIYIYHTHIIYIYIYHI